MQHIYTVSAKIPKKGLYQNGPSPKRPRPKRPQKFYCLKIVQNGPLHCPKRPIIQPKRPIAKSKTAHSDIQNGQLSLSAFGNVQSDVEILYVEASYTRVRGLDDSETVKCSATHYGVTCSKFKSVNASTVCKIATFWFAWAVFDLHWGRFGDGPFWSVPRKKRGPTA